MSNNIRLLLIGAGPMAVDYAKVIKHLGYDMVVVGRGKESAATYKAKTGIDIVSGGLDEYLKHYGSNFTHAIVATGIDVLAENCFSLFNTEIKNVLVEKPAGLYLDDIKKVYELATSLRKNVFVAYNRRFYSSVEKTREIIESDGGIKSFHFEFTEWTHKFLELKKSPEMLAHLFLGNSTHVVDLAFHIGGVPQKMECFHSGSFDWHPSAAIFCGAGISQNNALFTYHSNWQSAGRWGVELLTEKHRIILKPLEDVHIQKLGSIQIEKVDIDNQIDIDFKPGLYKQLIAFIQGGHKNMCTIEEHYNNCEFYKRISNYSN
ncbi:MAG: Gfo/Idh/MocA family oxidoreductase [Bacteroidota bacterium]